MTKTQHRFHSILFTDAPLLQNVLIALLASALLGLVSQIAIHLWWPVPITLQSAMVVLLGLTLGSKRALAAVGAYLLEGAIGAPVFAGGMSGFIHLIGPSGGYLWGFLPGAFIAGFLMERGMARNFFLTFLTALIASSVIFLVGVFHLALMIDWQKAYNVGVAPFLMIEPIKLLIASFIATYCWKKD